MVFSFQSVFIAKICWKIWSYLALYTSKYLIVHIAVLCNWETSRPQHFWVILGAKCDLYMVVFVLFSPTLSSALQTEWKLVVLGSLDCLICFYSFRINFGLILAKLAIKRAKNYPLRLQFEILHLIQAQCPKQCKKWTLFDSLCFLLEIWPFGPNLDFKSQC